MQVDLETVSLEEMKAVGRCVQPSAFEARPTRNTNSHSLMASLRAATTNNIHTNELNDFVNFHCPKLKLAGPALQVLTLYF